jgi:multidrug/hemolysin transport system permease protein
MYNALLLAQRNLRIYLRDRTAVFLSFLGAIILVLLYILFIFKLNMNGITDEMDKQGIPYTEKDISYFINTWVVAGIVFVTTVTTGLGALAGYVDDRVTNRFTEFVVMPIQRWQIVLGYYLSGLTASFGMATFVLLGGWGAIFAMEGHAPSPLNILYAWGLTFVCSAAFTALNIFLVTLTASLGAFVSLSTITGTMIGFLAAAYIPEHMMPNAVSKAINVLPWAHGASLIRQALAVGPLETVCAGDNTGLFIKQMRLSYTMDLYTSGSIGTMDAESFNLPHWVSPVYLVALTVVCGTLAVIRLNRRIGR